MAQSAKGDMDPNKKATFGFQCHKENVKPLLTTCCKNGERVCSSKGDLFHACQRSERIQGSKKQGDPKPCRHIPGPAKPGGFWTPRITESRGNLQTRLGVGPGSRCSYESAPNRSSSVARGISVDRLAILGILVVREGVTGSIPGEWIEQV